MPTMRSARLSLTEAKYTGKLHNRILKGLPLSEIENVCPFARPVSLAKGQVLYEPHALIADAYFLNSGLDSIVAIMSNGECTEVGVTGRDGFLGASLLLSVKSMPYRALVQIAGEAFAIKAEVLGAIVEQNSTFRQLATRFVQAHTVQIMQTAACNRLHDAEQRLARWLLLAHDRVGSNDIPLSQEFLAIMLGIRRESVTAIVRVLEEHGCIDRRRGLLMIADRRSLEKFACECYRVVRDEFDRLMIDRLN